MASDRYQGWALVGLAALGSIAGGVLIGEQASAEMAPFYANLATTMPRERPSEGVEIVSDEGSRAWVEAAELSYRPDTADDMQDDRY